MSTVFILKYHFQKAPITCHRNWNEVLWVNTHLHRSGKTEHDFKTTGRTILPAHLKFVQAHNPIAERHSQGWSHPAGASIRFLAASEPLTSILPSILATTSIPVVFAPNIKLWLFLTICKWLSFSSYWHVGYVRWPPAATAISTAARITPTTLFTISATVSDTKSALFHDE